MTIGVAASGACAGAAVRAAVLGAELFGRGAIGGFAVFAVLDEAGRLDYRVTQRGGIGALALPDAWMTAKVAAVISSGPDRPEPLTQFLVGAAGVGLVTGHRIPNSLGDDGVALNQAVLERLTSGEAPQSAVDQVLAASPELDVGLIAIGADGQLGWGDSARVLRRDDRGSFQRDDGASRLALAHNSIFSSRPLAEALGELAWAALHGREGRLRALRLNAAVPVRRASRDAVHIDSQGRVELIESANPELSRAQRRGTAIYLGSQVLCQGRPIGRVETELVAELAEGIATPLPGSVPSTLLMSVADVVT